MAGSSSERTQKLRAVLTSHGGLLYAELDQVAMTLMAFIELQLSTMVQQFQSVRGTSASISRIGYGPTEEGAFRTAASHTLQIVAQTSDPAPGNANAALRVFIAKTKGERYPFRLDVGISSPVGSHAQSERIRLADVHPKITPSLEARIHALLESEYVRMADALQTQAADALHQRGLT